MPKLAALPPVSMTPLTRAFIIGLRLYIAVVGTLVFARIVLLATDHG